MPNSCSGYLFTHYHIWKLVSMAYINAISIPLFHVINANEFEEIEFHVNEFHEIHFHEIQFHEIKFHEIHLHEIKFHEIHLHDMK